MLKSRLSRILWQFVMALIGLVLILVGLFFKLNENQDTILINLLIYLGSASIITALIAIFREYFILKSENEDLISDLISKIKNTGEEIASRISSQIMDIKDKHSGMRMISHDRFENYQIYNNWATEQQPQDLSFFGRAVLHRIDLNLKNDGLGAAENRFLDKLKENSKIRVMFLNPLSEIIKPLSLEEGKDMLLESLTRSIGVVKRLHHLLKKDKLPHQSEIRIRVYNFIPYFSYHKDNQKSIIGFYFSASSVIPQPAYEILNQYEGRIFENFFNVMFEKGQPLLEFIGHDKKLFFDNNLYDTIYGFLGNNLEKHFIDQVIIGE